MGRIRNKIKRDGLVNSIRHEIIKKSGYRAPYIYRPSQAELKEQRDCVFARNPLISIVTPLYRTPTAYLNDLILSVEAQTYETWELVFVDFSPSSENNVENTVKRFGANDTRILYYRDDDNAGIAQNTNKCIEKANGDYIAILDHDDVLHQSALFFAVQEINKGADFIYTDEIKFNGSINHCYSPNFKPDFAREELFSHNYICHFNVYKKDLLNKVGLYRAEANGSQDHDMVLRLTEHAECISHIPKILYFWRIHEASVAANIAAKPYATLSGIWSVEKALERMGLHNRVESVRDNIPTYHIIPSIDVEAQHNIIVVIWGGSKNDAAQTKKILESKYSNLEYKIVTNENDFLTVYEMLDAVHDKHNKYVLFIRAGISIKSNDFIEEMLTELSIKNVGMVEAELWNSDGTRCSEGISIDTSRRKDKVILRGHNTPSSYEGFEASFIYARNSNAASGLCTMIRISDLNNLEGNDFERSDSAFAISEKLNRDNVKIVWTPFAKAESISVEVDKEISSLIKKEAKLFKGKLNDPYFNKTLYKYHLESYESIDK